MQFSDNLKSVFSNSLLYDNSLVNKQKLIFCLIDIFDNLINIDFPIEYKFSNKENESLNEMREYLKLKGDNNLHNNKIKINYIQI